MILFNKVFLPSRATHQKLDPQFEKRCCAIHFTSDKNDRRVRFKNRSIPRGLARKTFRRQ